MNVAPQREQSLDRHPIASRRVLQPTPLVRPLVLLLRRLVVACRVASFAGIFAIVAPAPMPLSHWRRRRCCASIFANRRRRLPPLPLSMPPSNAAVNPGRYPPPPQSNYISLSPSPHRSPLPPSNAATLPLPSNVPATTTPSAVAGRRRRQPPLPPAAAAAGPPPPPRSPSPPLSNSLSSIAEESGNSNTTTSVPTAAPRENVYKS